MLLNVSDARSSPADQINHAVKVLGRSKHRLAVFRYIYRGKKEIKTVNEIATSVGLKRIRILQEGRFLADNQIIHPIRLAGTTAYKKDRFYSAYKKKILRLVQGPLAFSTFPTKTQPQATFPVTIQIKIPQKRVQTRIITIDDIEPFKKVRNIRVEPNNFMKIPESRFKHAICKILGQSGQFKDWGGERNDLYTNKIILFGKRLFAAFAFKGPGTKGKLTPGKMGKNGDQIQRLFKTPASVFIVQYWGQVDESVIEQMEEFAKAKSAVDGTLIHFGIIDGDDSNRLFLAYRTAFN